jgi:hypothetical protein
MHHVQNDVLWYNLGGQLFIRRGMASYRPCSPCLHSFSQDLSGKIEIICHLQYKRIYCTNDLGQIATQTIQSKKSVFLGAHTPLKANLYMSYDKDTPLTCLITKHSRNKLWKALNLCKRDLLPCF